MSKTTLYNNGIIIENDNGKKAFINVKEDEAYLYSGYLPIKLNQSNNDSSIDLFDENGITRLNTLYVNGVNANKILSKVDELKEAAMAASTFYMMGDFNYDVGTAGVRFKEWWGGDHTRISEQSNNEWDVGVDSESEISNFYDTSYGTPTESDIFMNNPVIPVDGTYRITLSVEDTNAQYSNGYWKKYTHGECYLVKEYTYWIAWIKKHYTLHWFYFKYYESSTPAIVNFNVENDLGTISGTLSHNMSNSSSYVDIQFNKGDNISLSFKDFNGVDMTSYIRSGDNFHIKYNATVQLLTVV